MAITVVAAAYSVASSTAASACSELTTAANVCIATSTGACSGVERAVVTADCNGFTVTASGRYCGAASVVYRINLMPSTGESIPLIENRIDFVADGECRFVASGSGAWPTGVDLVGATFNGTAELWKNVGDDWQWINTICFPPDETTGSFACGPCRTPLFDEPVACTPGKTVSIGPSSMQGAIKISNGDWVNGGYSMKSNVSGKLTIGADVIITGPCSNGGTDSVVIPLATKTYTAPKDAEGWLPTGDANSVLSWQGAVQVGVTSPPICGGVGKLDASKGAIFKAVVSADPPEPGATVTFRFKYRDPAAKGKPNTNCLDTSDPNRNKADVCGASWSATKTFDP